MNETLRPSTLGEILDRTASLYRSRFLVFFGLATIPSGIVLGAGGGMMVLLTASGTMTTTGAAGANPAVTTVVVLGLMLLGLVALPLMIGANAVCGAALCHAASTILLGGTVTIASALKAVWKRGWHYVGLYLLQAVIIFGVPFGVWTALVMALAVGAAVAAGAGGGGGGALLSGALVLLVFLGLMVYAAWMLVQIGLAFPIAVVERAGIGVALKRAWYLCRGTRGRMLAVFALIVVMGWVASTLISLPLILLILLVPGMNSAQHQQLMGTVALIGVYGMSFVVQALSMPVIAIALVLFYYDQRVRKEAFDIEWLMQSAGMALAPLVPPEPVPSMPAAPPAAESEAAPDEVAEGTSTTEAAPSEPAASGEPA